MTDELTVVERLERLERLANHLYATQVNCAEAYELRNSLRHVIRDIQECIDDDVRNCVHCRSPFTYRRSDGDIACHDCPGIMPRQYRCDACGQTGTKEELADTPCSWDDDGTHNLSPDTRICPRCGKQDTAHDPARHNCPATEVSK